VGTARAETVELRPVNDADVEIFYEQQREPEGVAMAMFPSRPREAFFSHWQRTSAQPDANRMTITFGGAVAGNIGSWATNDEDNVLVGYWIGNAFWGKGIATAALQLYLARHELRRPLHARVVSTNVGSIRVLEKCGFELVGRRSEFDEAFGVDVEELLLAYRR